MKKQFFYAAFAIAMMASCTNEENPVVDQPTPEEDKVAIELGVNTPNIVTSRGTGTVGGVTGEENATTWNGQTLNIIMVDANGTPVNEEKENGSDGYIFEGLTFKAPTGTDDNIKIYAGEATNGIIQHKYYPVNGTFEFYGYHKDDATGGEESFTAAGATVTGLTIDGSQDILAAKTIKLAENYDANSPYIKEGSLLSETNWNDMYKNQFSARTARNGITPILDFKHQLARLKFYVKSGNAESGAVYVKVDEDYKERSKTAGIAIDEYRTCELYDGAIYITDIIAEDMADVIDLNLKEQTVSRNGESTDDFKLKSSPAEDAESNLLTFLQPVAPMYPLNAKNVEGYTEQTPVGESMMFYPVEGSSDTEVILTLNLLQRVLDQELEEGATGVEGETYPKYIDKKMTTQVKLKAPEEGFQAGSSYDVFITIYSLEEIKISAQLTAWKDGGDVDVDIENDNYTEDNITDESGN